MQSEKATQETFRMLLDAMSHPGRICRSAEPPGEDPLLVLARSILDREVSFNVLPASRTDLQQAIWVQTRARISDPERADFLFVARAGSDGFIRRVKRGTAEYPDRSTTVIYHAHALAEGGSNGASVSLRMPGVPERLTVEIHGIPASEFRLLHEVNSAYPLGVDTVFVDNAGGVLCIPRYVVIEVHD